MSSVRFHEAAPEEAEAAVRWYNERLAGLGEDSRVYTREWALLLWLAFMLGLPTCQSEPAPAAVAPAPSAPRVAPPALPPSSVSSAASAVSLEWLPGFVACDPTFPKTAPHEAKILSVDDQLFGALQLRPSLNACVAGAPQARTPLNLILGIQPNGRICGARLDAAQLSAGSLACMARALQRYRFPKSDTLNELVLPCFVPATRR